MTLRSKIAIIFTCLFFAFALLEYLITQIFIQPSFVKLEKKEAEQNISRCIESIDNAVNRLDDLCRDWAAWNESYDFIKTGSKEFHEGNLIIEAFTAGQLNLIYFVKPTGKLFWGRIYDLKTEKEIKMNAFTADTFQETFKEIKWVSAPDKSLGDIRKTGILKTEKGLIMLSTRPLLTSEITGPPRGTLIMGRFFDQTLMNTLQKQIKMKFKIYICDKNLSPELRTVVKKISSSSQNVFLENDNHITMYTVYIAINGKPAFLVEMKFPKEITEQGIVTINSSLVFLFIIGLVIIITAQMLIQHTIIKPIYNLSKHAAKVEDGDLSIRISSDRKDSIGKLANNFDHMVATLEKQTNQLVRANRKLEQLSVIDGLTGLNNRRFFDESLVREWKRMIRENKPLSAIMCDVDFFKLYNDYYGHQMGDTCLKSVAMAIKGTVNRSSDITARYGGEEFVILLPDTSPEGAHYIAETIRDAVQDLSIKHVKSDINEYVTLSLGVASAAPGQNSSPIDLINTAGKALYNCKEKGRNQVVLGEVSKIYKKK